jgi:hypothetical protein
VYNYGNITVFLAQVFPHATANPPMASSQLTHNYSNLHFILMFTLKLTISILQMWILPVPDRLDIINQDKRLLNAHVFVTSERFDINKL